MSCRIRVVESIEINDGIHPSQTTLNMLKGLCIHECIAFMFDAHTDGSEVFTIAKNFELLNAVGCSTVHKSNEIRYKLK